jgi:2-C-methyl-D-erythritol 4-phosphate cytidylyltransferase
MRKIAVIVAGGSGKRFGGAVPKQFLVLDDKPVIMHTINRFFQADASVEIVLVLPQQQFDLWKELCDRYHFSVRHCLVAGGDSRFQSVKNALAAVDVAPGDCVAVHDGVRPLVTPALINRAFTVAAELGCAIPVVPVTDSIREILSHDSSVALSRDVLRSVQTPQTFNAVALKKAYQVDYCPSFTDDASVYEAAGGTVHVIEGEVTNIKITHPVDLIIAQSIMRDE